MLKRALLTATALALLTACGSSDAGGGGSDALKGGVPVRATYDVVVDKSRTIEVSVDASYRPFSSVEEADAGEADIFVQAKGKVTYKNKSKDRAIGDGDGKHELTYMLPFDACLLSPIYAGIAEDRDLAAEAGTLYCSVTIDKLSSPALEPGESVTQDIDVTTKDTSVDENDAAARVAAGKKAVIVAGADERYKITGEGLNPECVYGKDKTVRTVLFSTNPSVTPCSSEPSS
jgi:hypothetical protein